MKATLLYGSSQPRYFVLVDKYQFWVVKEWDGKRYTGLIGYFPNITQLLRGLVDSKFISPKKCKSLDERVEEIYDLVSNMNAKVSEVLLDRFSSDSASQIYKVLKEGKK